jgi:hypothetical protein
MRKNPGRRNNNKDRKADSHNLYYSEYQLWKLMKKKEWTNITKIGTAR